MTKLEKAEQARRFIMKTKVSSVQNEATRSAHLLDAFAEGPAPFCQEYF